MNSLKNTIWDTLIRPHRRFHYDRKSTNLYVIIFGYPFLVSKFAKVSTNPIKDILNKNETAKKQIQ